MISDRKKAYLALILSELIWGASIPLAKLIYEDISAFQYLFLRYMFATPIVIIIILRNIKKIKLSLNKLIIVLAVESIAAVNTVLLYIGLEFVSSIESSLIVQARPVFVTIAGILFLKERQEKHEWLGLLLSVLGTLFVLVAPLVGSNIQNNVSIVGLVLIILTNFIYTLTTILLKKFYTNIPQILISNLHILLGFIICFLYLFAKNDLPSISALAGDHVFPVLLFTSIFGLVIALSLSYYGINKIEASEAVLFMYLEPLVYIPLSIFLLGESFSIAQVVGLILIVLGVFWGARRINSKNTSSL
ncbi:DMT family transporter [Candidatus Dojkabacteria bacterium]|nr:DMT family transporter [Candidatus Dojkabacteria bacterium]